MTAPLLARDPDGGWLAATRAGVSTVLGDERFVIPDAGPSGPPGTVAWLRASVSRFANGPVHETRRHLAVRLLAGIAPADLRADAYRRAGALLGSAGPDAVTLVARRVPSAALAAALGAAEPDGVADLVPACAAGYFPGGDETAIPAADRATAQLVARLRRPGEPATSDDLVARIALLVQGFQPGADLIAATIRALPSAVAGDRTDAVLAEVLRHDPPVRAMRRVAAADALVGSVRVVAGERIGCDIAAANRDPSVVDHPETFDPRRRPPAPHVTFGAGPRACPGAAHAFAVAAGAIDAIRAAMR